MCGPAAEAGWSEVLHQGRLLRLVLRHTPWGTREIVEHPGAVAILITDARDRVLLVRQHREGARSELWEIPAGTLEPGEKPYVTAQRELREETNLEGKLRYLGAIHPTPGYSTERIFLFQLEGLNRVPEAAHEIEEARFFTVEEILDLARRGKGDGKTLAALALFLRQRRV